MSARRSDHVDTYHGTEVADPYRWLEDPDSDETRAWVVAQNEAAEAHLSTLPERDRLRTRLTELWDFERPGTPFRRGDHLFRFHNPGLANQDMLQISTDGGTTWATALNPNELSDDGTRALNAAAVSRDGRHLAYAVSDGGSDWQSWFVRDLDTGEDLDDELRWSKFSGAAWLPDGSGFFYGRYAAPAEGAELTGANRDQQLWFHRPGTGQGDDVLVYERPDQPDWFFGAEVSDDGTLLVLSVARDTSPRSYLLVRRIDEDDPLAGDFTPVTPEFESSYVFLGNDGSQIDLLTDLDAPRGRIVRIDLDDPGAPAVELVTETDDRIDHATAAGAGYLIARLHHAAHEMTWVDRQTGDLVEVPLPPLGSVVAVSGRPGDPEAWVGFTDFFTPITPYSIDLSDPAGGIDVAPAAHIDIPFSAAGYVSERRFATSTDGTRVPYFVVHREGIEQTGTNPTLLYGYGGFDISLTPTFSPARLPWLEAGGVYVLCILRGGGEYGEAWHEGGILDRKQNVFDDLFAIAEDLIATGITSPDHLAVEGGSNGGLLVGAAITQRPDLFAAAHPAVGVMDMLRFHLFTIGWAWCSDYGSSDDPDQFRTLLGYSPLHNIEPGTEYPATIVTTGDHDDRVVPAHSFKFTAELQHAHVGPAPVIARIQTRAGHGAGKPTRLLIEEHADVLAFLLDATR